MRSLDELKAVADEVQALLASKDLDVVECLFILSLLQYVMFHTLIEAEIAGRLEERGEAA